VLSRPTTWALHHFGCWYAALKARLNTNNGLRDGNTTDGYQQRQRTTLKKCLLIGTLRRTGETNHNIPSFYFLLVRNTTDDMRNRSHKPFCVVLSDVPVPPVYPIGGFFVTSWKFMVVLAGVFVVSISFLQATNIVTAAIATITVEI